MRREAAGEARGKMRLDRRWIRRILGGVGPSTQTSFRIMTSRPVRRLAVIVAVAASGLAAGSFGDTTSPPVVYSAEVDSIIHPVSAEYMIETMDRADHAGVALVVFTLRTPGGLVDS